MAEHSFRLHFLCPSDVEDRFCEDVHNACPAEIPSRNVGLSPIKQQRSNNAAESFHAHFNAQFYTAHPTFFIFLELLVKLQATTYVKMRGTNIVAPYEIIFLCRNITIWLTEGVITCSLTGQTWSLPGKFAHLYDFLIRSFHCMVCRSFHTLSRYDFRSNVIRPPILGKISSHVITRLNLRIYLPKLKF